MSEQLIVIYTMDGCPYCVMMKEELDKLNIPFVCRDIDEEEQEYELFVKAVGGNEYVPAFMTIETDGKKHKTNFYAPERDFNEISDGVEIIKEFYNRFN
jgi:glutaredoxin